MRARRLFARVLPVILLLLLVGCRSVDLHVGLTGTEAQEMVVLLQQNGVHAKKSVVGEADELTWSVSVPPSRVSDALELLAEHDLPRVRPGGFADLINNSKLIPTETEERASFLHALCGELAQTIEAMPAVVDARVHLAIPADDPLRRPYPGEPQRHPTAGVYVEQQSSGRSRVTDDDIRRLVASSVDGLEPENVTVVRVEVSTAPAETRDPITLVVGLIVDFLPAIACAIAIFALLILEGRTHFIGGLIARARAAGGTAQPRAQPATRARRPEEDAA